MKKLVTTVVAAIGLVVLPACDEPEDSEDSDFRTHPQNGDLQVHQGTATTDPDCLAWDIVGPEVYEGDQTVGNLLWEVDGLEIYGNNGQLECTMQWVEANYIEIHEGSANGPVVASQWRNHMFFGDVSSIDPSIRWQFADHTFWEDHITDGLWYDEKIATATETIALATPQRRAVLGALVMGICGSNGLPEGPPQ